MRRSPVWHYFELGKALVYGGGTLNLLNHWRREGLYKEVALKSAQK